MRLSFVGITPDTPDSQCPAVFVDEDTGEIWFQGETVTDLAQITAWPSVSLGIIPATLDRGEARPVEDFWIFDNEQVAVELVSGHLTITQPREIAMYAQTFARLAEIAVYGTRASELLSALARTM